MTRAAWWTLGPAPVEVRNLSDRPLRDLKVRIETCATLAELPPNRTWRVPLPVEDDGGATLTFTGLAVKTNDANSYVTPGLKVQFEVHGLSEIEQRFF